TERGEPEITEPAPPIDAPDPERENDGQKTDSGSDEAMGVLEKDSPDPFRDWKKKHVVAERGGPVGHGETDAFARDHSPATDEKERGDGGEPDETVQPPIGVLADRGRGTGIRFVGRHRTNLAA